MDLQNKLSEVSRDLDSKTDKSEFKMIKSRFESFAEIENIRNLEMSYMPRIKKYQETMDKLELSN